MRERLILFLEENGEGANEIHFKTFKMVSGENFQQLSQAFLQKNTVLFGSMFSWQFLTISTLDEYQIFS